MILYLDTSALVKLFAEEVNSDLVRDAVMRAEFRGCHIIGYAEACAAIARRGRESGSSPEAIASSVSELTGSWAELDVIAADWPLVRRAGQLAVQFDLRGYDSVHLAAAEAVWTRTVGAGEFRFAVFDSALAGAAQKLGIEVLRR